MKLVPISIDDIVLRKPLPCALRDSIGTLLASKGSMVASREALEAIVGKRSDIYIDADDKEDNLQRGYVNRLNSMMLSDNALGQIAETKISLNDAKKKEIAEVDDENDWMDLQTKAHAMLRNENAETFLPRLEYLQSRLNQLILRNPDGALLALIQLTSNDANHYSATHAMLVTTMCHLAARDILKWSETDLKALNCATFTMNLGMTELQDRLATQTEPLSASQLKHIGAHSAKSIDMLQQFGVSDALWFEAILNHHTKEAGSLSTRSDGQRLARLIQRADMFAARLSPRASRSPEVPSVAIQSCYFDENRKVDEAGAALIKAVGVYSPGTYVKLTSQEIAVVIKRGSNTTMPKVAVLINRQGMPTGEPLLRDTSRADFRILESLAFRSVKVNNSLKRLLPLTSTDANRS